MFCFSVWRLDVCQSKCKWQNIDCIQQRKSKCLYSVHLAWDVFVCLLFFLNLFEESCDSDIPTIPSELQGSESQIRNCFYDFSLPQISLILQAQWNSRITEKDAARWLSIVDYFPPKNYSKMEQIKQEFYEAKTLSFKMRRTSSEPSASSPSSARCVRAVFCNHSLPDYIYSLIFVLTFIAS